METRIDFIQLFQLDMVLNILMHLDDPADLMRASSVSRFWHHFMIANGICKQLSLRLFPQLSNVACIIEPSCGMEKSDAGCSNNSEWETLEREHRAYAFLVQSLTRFTPSDCIRQAISASSTDNYPEESIHNTLDPRDRILGRASYWSSKGQRDPEVPETLIYKMFTNFCVVTEINVGPFQAFFQADLPIYSAKSVRFRMGHPKSLMDIETDPETDSPLELPADDKFTWTYVSEEFPMAQENHLQKFKLPAPALCIGGYLQIELLGRVQKQEMDGLFYMCVSHVEVMGQPFHPAFDAEILEPSGKFVLNYFKEARYCASPTTHRSYYRASPHRLANLRSMDAFLDIFQGDTLDIVHHHPNEENDDNDNKLDSILM